MTTIHRFFTWVKSFWLFWWSEKETHEPPPVNYGHDDPWIWEPNYEDPKL